ncbi:hypothetical protein ACWFQT_19330, partial [Cellulosimicrobium cellulans]
MEAAQAGLLLVEQGVVGARALQGPGAGVRAGVGVQSRGGVMVKRAFTWAWTVWRWGSRSRGGA